MLGGEIKGSKKLVINAAAEIAQLFMERWPEEKNNLPLGKKYCHGDRQAFKKDSNCLP